MTVYGIAELFGSTADVDFRSLRTCHLVVDDRMLSSIIHTVQVSINK